MGHEDADDIRLGDGLMMVDQFDIRAIAALSGRGPQAFRFIGMAALSSPAGELRIERSGTSTIVMGDVNGDATGDFEIELQNFTNTAAISALDFMR